jgi:hypothetical protein
MFTPPKPARLPASLVLSSESRGVASLEEATLRVVAPRHTTSSRTFWKKIMTTRFSLFLLCTFFAVGCLQKVDDGLAAGGALPGPMIELPACGGAQGFACNFPVNMTTPDIGLKANKLGDVTDSADPSGPCAKVTQDTADILKRKCVGCHEGAANAPGAPLTFITDPKLLTTTPSSSKFGGQPYIKPGDPEASLIYMRAVIKKDMPLQSPLSPPTYLTVSESSVLRQWIVTCVDGAPPPAPVETGGMGAGGTGTGGMGAGGTGTGGMGAFGAGGGEIEGGSSPFPFGGAGGFGAGGGDDSSTGASGGETGGSGGAAGTASGGAAGNVGRPCGGLCRNPMLFTVPGLFQSDPLGAAAACYQTTSPLTGFTCSNATGRTFSINDTTVDCAAPPLPTDIPLRNGGYCVRATAGGDATAFFTAY